MNLNKMSVLDFNTKLSEDFPQFFTDQFWGVECSSGWFTIIYDLCLKFAALQNPNFVITQIKEKFGGLRVYTSRSTPEIDDLIRKAEGKANTTCEVCGATEAGRSSINGWLRILCSPCHKNLVTQKNATEDAWAQV